MKVALIKQILDVFGPWSSVLWKDTDHKRIFDIWPGKAVLWEMTCLLKADWYVIPQQLETDYTADAVLQYPGRTDLITKYTTNVSAPTNIPLEEYDVVITIDPILDVPKRMGTLFAYYMREHWDRLYSRSLQRPIGNYDLFLAHMMDAREELASLPQAVSFPYLRAPEVVRSLFQLDKEEAVWVDWRTLQALGMTERWSEASEAAARRVEAVIGLPTRYKGDIFRSKYGVVDPPSWGDALGYLEGIGRCRFYIGVGRYSGAGQGLCDAASLGCICFGEQDKAYHSLLCHPACLCSDMAEMPIKVRKVVSSTDLQAEILAWQDKALREYFVNRPLSIIEKAIRIKHEGLVFAKPQQS